MDYSRLSFDAMLYDGVSATARPVTVLVAGSGEVQIREAERVLVAFQLQEIGWEPPVGNAPLIFKLLNGMQFEAPFREELVEALIRRLPWKGSLVRVLERRILWAFSLTVIAIGVAAAIYVYGIPAAARLAKPFIPYAWKQEAGGQIFTVLDRYFFSPSNLPVERQQHLQAVVRRMHAYTKLRSTPQLVIRSLSKSGTAGKLSEKKEVANAFALLPDKLVVTDALLEKLTDDEIEGVLAHELGHLEMDHGTQMLLKSSLTSGLTLFIFGLDPNALQGVALSIVDSRYSRNQERDADLYAADLLFKAGKSAALLISALQRLTGRPESSFEKYISSHPPTSARIALLEAAAQRTK